MSPSRSSRVTGSASSARNGAGKSTLLKILSRITEPTTGRSAINGRVASLLEVGTGFHPELTGRENIFLNGAILGMGKSGDQAEVRRDRCLCRGGEVSRYAGQALFFRDVCTARLCRCRASGAGDSDVDEVLAVGDAQFQKKCLGKMEDVSEGRADGSVCES